MYRTEYTVLLLKSMALNYPVIKHLGLELGKLLFVLTEPGQMKAAASLFSDMEAPVISEFTKKVTVKRLLFLQIHLLSFFRTLNQKLQMITCSF